MQFEFIAKTLYGLENVLAAELEALGASRVHALTRAVRFEGDMRLLYRANLELRTALSVLRPIASFGVFNEKQYYKKLRHIPWDQYLGLEDTFAIDGLTFSDVINHSQYVALRAKDAIADQFMEAYGKRPSVDTREPDIRIAVHLAGNSCTVSLDSSGETLAKRGYKQQQTQAPLSEVLAAGLLLLSGWDGETEFIDPMCGSGTLPIEAALLAYRIPAGHLRHFAFEKWKDFEPELWQEVQTQAQQQVKQTGPPIWGFDLDHHAIMAAKENARLAGVADKLRLSKRDFFGPASEAEEAFLLMNPPYGQRLGQPEELTDFYGQIGTQLKHHYPGCEAWIFSGAPEGLKQVGLRAKKKHKLYNGAIECKLHQYELYRGSRKRGKGEEGKEEIREEGKE